MTETTKECPRCGESLPISAFTPRNTYCKKCKSQRAMERYWNEPEYREKRKAWHRENERKKRANPEWNAKALAKLRDRYANDPAVRERAVGYYRKHRHKSVFTTLTSMALRRAKRDGREATITVEFVRGMWSASQSCRYCGVELRIADGVAAHNSPSLDRVDPTKGYTEQNTVLACWRCNSLKRDATADEIEALAVNFRRVSAAARI